MQRQSGFAGLVEINMIPNKETRWSHRFLFFTLAQTGELEEVKKKDLGFKAMMHKGRTSHRANDQKASFISFYFYPHQMHVTIHFDE